VRRNFSVLDNERRDVAGRKWARKNPEYK
jgi:hypothetical protein